MAGPLTPLFLDMAVGAVEKGIDFAINPQNTVNQITNSPKAFGG